MKRQIQYHIEKWVWNQDDFEQMGWHDSRIWAMSFDDHVKFDLDYILKWVEPQNSYGTFRFWISPVTLVFRNPSKFKMEMDIDFVNGLEILDIERKSEKGKTQYIVEAQEGKIIIETEKFYQVVRRPPTLQIFQSLSEVERGPISFSEHPDTSYTSSPRAMQARELSYEFDDLRNQKTKLELEFAEFNFEPLTPKQRILKKREYKSLISELKNKITYAETEMNKAYNFK